MTEDQIRRTVWTLEWQCYGKDRGDADYWVSKWPELVARGVEIGEPDYAQHRVMGAQGTGPDAPIYGPYANPPRGFFLSVPPYPGDVVTPPPDNPPVENPPDTSILDGFDKRLKSIEDAVIGLALVMSKGFADVIAAQSKGYTNKWIGDVTPKK